MLDPQLRKGAAASDILCLGRGRIPPPHRVDAVKVIPLDLLARLAATLERLKKGESVGGMRKVNK